MRTIVIFSGTTEGRRLSDMLSADGIFHHVCVATEYGRQMTKEGEYADIHVGRMDREEMTDYLKGLDLSDGLQVVDATHPYAAEATLNIKNAAKNLDIDYIRVIRQSVQGLFEDECTYNDIGECAAAVDISEGNILLTTGSKEIKEYMSGVSKQTAARTYVRVLPSVESIETCISAGIRSDHIIAMHGPFGTELNEAVMRQYDIRHLITKDTGDEGGFCEKIDAAASCGARVYVISRPGVEDGMSVDEAYTRLTGRSPESGTEGQAPVITLIGAGMGGKDTLTVQGLTAVRDAEAVFGSGRLTDGIKCKGKHALYRAEDIIPVLEKEKIKRAAVLFSGDTGFFSGAKKALLQFRRWRSDADVRIIPGISSFSYLAAKLGESYEDAGFFSLHGKPEKTDMAQLMDMVRHQSRVYVLLSGASDVVRIEEAMADAGINARIVAGCDLSGKNESIEILSLKEAAAYQREGVVTALICNDAATKRKLINLRSDEDFIRGAIPMTKECVRHESIIRLGLKEGGVFYDIGGGTGSVAIEAAGLHPSLRVVTIEKNEAAAKLIRENIKKAGLFNITVIERDAIDALSDLPKPDCVFIGGSSGRLEEIIKCLHSKGDGIRFVINAVTFETLEKTKRILDLYRPDDEKTVMLQISDVIKTGDYHMPKAQSPVFIFSFKL